MYRLPKYYEGILEFDYLQNALKSNEDYFLNILEELKDELFIINAKNSGLKVWSNTLDSSEDKIEILNKLRGLKTITKYNLALIIQNILKQNSKIEITEQNSIYRVLIGVQLENAENVENVENMLRKTLKNIIPSHLEIKLYINGLIWEKYDLYNKKWSEWDSLDLTWEQLEKYNESIIL